MILLFHLVFNADSAVFVLSYKTIVCLGNDAFCKIITAEKLLRKKYKNTWKQLLLLTLL